MLARPSAGIGVVFSISKVPARPSAGIGVVEVQKLGFFAISAVLARPSAGIGVVEVQKLGFFLRFLRCSRDPLRGSAWSRCKNPWFFCDFCGARATLCRDRRGRGAKTRGFLRLLLFELVLGSCLVVRAPAPGTGGSRVRFLPGPRAGVARCNLHFKATCAEQLGQSKLHRATCADQLAPTSLRRAPCLEQLAQSNLRRATYAEQLAQSNLHRAPCLVLSRACFTNASCREKERILQRWADLACDVLLSGQPWSSLGLGFRLLVFAHITLGFRFLGLGYGLRPLGFAHMTLHFRA